VLVCPLKTVVWLEALVDAAVDNLRRLSTLYTSGTAGITIHRLYTSLQLLHQTVKQGSQRVVGLHFLLDFLTRVDNRRVIAPAELLTYVRE
jgi:hypothetical protein